MHSIQQIYKDDAEKLKHENDKLTEENQEIKINLRRQKID